MDVGTWLAITAPVGVLRSVVEGIILRSGIQQIADILLGLEVNSSQYPASGAKRGGRAPTFSRFGEAFRLRRCGSFRDFGKLDLPHCAIQKEYCQLVT